MATLDQVSPEVLSEIYGVLSEELGDYAASQMDGKEYVANVLINMGKDDRDELLAAISDADVELGEEIRKQMFTFEDLLKMGARDMQRLNRDVDNQTLMLSLKNCDRADAAALVQRHVSTCCSHDARGTGKHGPCSAQRCGRGSRKNRQYCDEFG